MSIYSSSNRSITSTRLDRTTWAGNTIVVIDYEIFGSGQTITEFLDFGTAYSESPFFTYGAELLPGQGITSTSTGFPLVSAGVSEWKTKDIRNEPSLYVGAKVWVSVKGTSYNLKLRFSFEGVALQSSRDIF